MGLQLLVVVLQAWRFVVVVVVVCEPLLERLSHRQQQQQSWLWVALRWVQSVARSWALLSVWLLELALSLSLGPWAWAAWPCQLLGVGGWGAWAGEALAGTGEAGLMRMMTVMVPVPSQQ